MKHFVDCSSRLLGRYANRLLSQSRRLVLPQHGGFASNIDVGMMVLLDEAMDDCLTEVAGGPTWTRASEFLLRGFLDQRTIAELNRSASLDSRNELDWGKRTAA